MQSPCSAAYQRFFDRLTGSDYAWEVPTVPEIAAVPVVGTLKPVDEKV